MSQAPKRVIDQDPDYESIPLHTQQKRIKLHEQDAKEAAVRKIEQIVRSQFSNEISSREAELELINQRIYQAQVILDRLRVGIITKYYAGGGNSISENGGTAASSTQQVGWQDSQQALASVHPTTRQYLGKAPPATHHAAASSLPLSGQDEGHRNHQAVEQKRTPLTLVASESSMELTPALASHRNSEPGMKERVAANGGGCGTVAAPRIGRGPRCKTKVRIIVGNVSKYIPLDRRDGAGGEQQATHKWLAYVRTAPGEPHCIGELVRHVRFFLHPSYRPHDLVQVTEAPFQVQRKGWGEFPLRVQLHFHDRWTKHVDIIHHLKLDKTYTGLQTLGAETVVDLWLPSSALGLPETPLSAADVDIAPPGGSRESTVTASERTELAELAVGRTQTAETGASSSTAEGTVIPVEDAESQCSSEAADGSALAAVSSGSSSRQVEAAEENSLDVDTAVDYCKGADTSCLTLVDTTTPVVLDQNKPTSTVHQIASSAGVVIPTTPPILTAATPPGCATVGSVTPPKLLLPKSPAQNGVISSFVKCTDALGRVLLIPATSLLSPSTVPSKQPSVLQPATVLGDTGLTTVTPPAKSVCLGAEAASKQAIGTGSLRTSVVGSPGASHAKPGSAVAIAPQQGSLLPKSAGKASLVALAPAGVPGAKGVLTSNVLAGGHKLAGVGAVPNVVNNGGAKSLSPAGLATSTGVAPSALRVIRPALPSTTMPPSLESGPSALLVRNSTTGLKHVNAVSPIVRPSSATATPNRTSLLSVVCNKPSAVGANVATPVLSATASTSMIAAAVTNNSGNVVCNKTVSQMADAASSVSTVSSAPATGPTAGMSTYTFVMLPGQNQIVLLSAGAVSAQDTAARLVALQEKPAVAPSVPLGSQMTVVSPAAVLQGQPEKVDLAKELQERLDAIRLSECRDLRSALFAVATHFPLVGVSADEKLSCFPYAATDSATFFSWPLPKQRASEWMRACDVRRTLERLLECQQPSWFAPSSAGSSPGLPSRRGIVLLCRRFGFTPLHSDVDSKPEEVELSGAEPCEHNSYSEPTELIARLADAASAVEEGVRDGSCDGEEEVDIDGVDSEEQPDDASRPDDACASASSEQGAGTSTSAAAMPHSSPEKSLLRKAKVHLPLSPVAAFVREAAAEVGIHLTGCELEPRIDVPVVEEMMVSACKNFATALLRSAVDAAFKRTRPDRTPSAVTLEDTYQGILHLPECSFLTNENLGIETTREGDEAHV